MFKNIYLCLAISIGVIAAILTALIYLLAETPSIDTAFGTTITTMVPPAFISWALYFAHGQSGTSFWKVGITNTIGVIVASLIVIIGVVVVNGMMGLPVWLGLGIGVLIGAFIMTYEATFTPLDFVPGAFCGCATAFALGATYALGGAETFLPVIQIILAFWIGLVCAFASEKWGNAMLKSE